MMLCRSCSSDSGSFAVPYSKHTLYVKDEDQAGNKAESEMAEFEIVR